MGKRPKWLTWVIAVGLIGAGAGCGDAAKTDKKTPGAQVDTAAKTEPVAFTVDSHSDGDVLHHGRIILRGSADEAAVVAVNAHPVTVNHSGHWRKTVKLDLGDNDIKAEASKDGANPVAERLTITRKRSASERAAFEERQRVKREQRLARERAARAARIAREQAARAAREANYKAAAVTLPYKQLNKNADKFSGTKVTYTGQILQIQEDSGGGGFMLVSVTDEGYGIYDDNVWVDYDGTVQGGEGDIVTFWGTVTGTKSYDTQIGGSTYVPQIHARYVNG